MKFQSVQQSVAGRARLSTARRGEGQPSLSSRRDETSRPTAGGFTLVELLLVLVILGILAAIVVPKVAGRSEQARDQACKTQIESFGTALDAFEVDNGFYPHGANGLTALIQQPSDAQNWKGPYLKSESGIPLDPWQTAYQYTCPGKHNPSSYDILSAGPDHQFGTADDIGNWLKTQ